MKLLICDEKKEITNIIWKQLEKCHDSFAFSKKAELATEIMIDIEENSFDYDIVILPVSIKTADYDGIRLAEFLYQFYPNCQIIFISGRKSDIPKVYAINHAFNMFETQITEYMRTALEQAHDRLEVQRYQFLKITNQRKHVIIRQKDILYITKSDRKIVICTTAGSYEQYGSLNGLLVVLGEDFRKCNAACVVNMRKIQSFDGRRLLLEDGTDMQFTRTYRKMLVG